MLMSALRTATFLLLLFALHSCNAEASDLSLRGGPAILNGRPSGSAKYFALRSETPDSLGVAYEAGGFVDNGGQGRRSSALLSAQLQVKPGQAEGLYARMAVGPALLTSPDSLLGGRLQFATDLGVGVRDRESFVLVGYKHVSSAGLAKPNRGRDFAVIEAGVRLW